MKDIKYWCDVCGVAMDRPWATVSVGENTNQAEYCQECFAKQMLPAPCCNERRGESQEPYTSETQDVAVPEFTVPLELLESKSFDALRID